MTVSAHSGSFSLVASVAEGNRLTGRSSHGAKKSLGQNFLVSHAVQKRIVDAVSAEKDELVFEVGAGKGALSVGLAESGAFLVAIETDEELVKELEGRLEGFENVEVVHADIRDFDLDGEAESRGLERYKVVGNIPYYLTSTILLKITVLTRCIRAVLMMQREVAERITAEPGSRECGALTILLQSYFRIEKLFRVKPGSFRPVPKVESTVLAFSPETGEGAPGERLEFFELIKKFFSMRRKKLETIIRKGFGIDIDNFERGEGHAGELLKKRPEELKLEEWYNLFYRIKRSGLV